MKNPSRSYDFLWLSIALLPLLVIVVLFPIQPHDYWWYLRLGRDVVETGAVPVIDTYSSTQVGQPIVYQSWMSAVILWLVYKTGEIPLTVFLITIFIGMAYALLWLVLRECGTGARISTLITLLAGLASSNNWTARPQIFAYPIFVAVLWILLKWQRREKNFLWLLVPLSWAWANLHGSFILFFVLLGIALLFGNGDRKKLFWASFASLAATLFNPRGFVLWQSVIGTFTSPGIRDLSPEWLPPINTGWQMNIFFAWLILMVPLAAFARKRISAFEWVLFLGFSWQALTGIRYVIWDIFLISALTAMLLPEHILQRFDQTPDVKSPGVNYALGTVFLLIPFMLLPSLRDEWWQGAPPALQPNTPVAATKWLDQHPNIPGPMWNEVVFGSYLIHALPSRPVWIDTRIQVIYTAEQAENYLFVQSAQDGWEPMLEEQGINLLFIAKTQIRLAAAAQNSTDWCKQYEDKVALIFSRCKPIP